MNELKEFAQKVDEMRKAQREYFKAKRLGMEAVAREWLIKSKAAEMEVDKATTEILADSRPQTLF